jgi:uncharacterized protein
MRLSYCSLAALLLAFPPAALTEQAPPSPPGPGTANFTVFLRGVRLGSEQVTVNRNATGTSITGSGRLAEPADVITRRYEIRYDQDWTPQELRFEGTVRGQLMTLNTMFSADQAATEITQAGQRSFRSDKVSRQPLVLADQFFGGYEALALRLASLSPDTELTVYFPLRTEIIAKVGSVAGERIQTPGRTIAARRYQVTFMPRGEPQESEIWVDETGRLLRVTIPSQAFDLARDDIASVAARRETFGRPDDEQVMIPSVGFSLAATVSRPSPAPAPGTRLPVVVLVGGAGSADRDETISGISIFGQMAAPVAEAGFLVVRYDKRGVGQSGGRSEAAAVEDYAEDVRAIVGFMRRREDVDRKRIALVGHGEGGWVALLAASKTDQIAALAEIAAPGVPGAELVLEQQRHTLDRMQIPDADKQARVELQKKIQGAVISGSGWTGIAPEVRRQADTPWFRSFLMFDPARVMRKVRQPILILQGELDQQVAAVNADRLAALAGARKPPRDKAVEVVRIPGINHLLLPATTGEVDEYGKLQDRKVSPALLSALTGWLQRQLGTGTEGQ